MKKFFPLWMVLSLMLCIFAAPYAAAGTIIHTYDNAGRLVKTDYGGGKTIEYTYDSNGNLLQREVIVATGNPVPDIKANGSDSAITVASGTPVSIAIGLNSGDKAGQNADWWVLKYGPDGWSYLGISGGSLLFLPGLLVTLQYPLFDFPSVGIFNTSGLSVRTHIFCFAVDLNMNGLT